MPSSIFQTTVLQGVYTKENKVFPDARGRFAEIYSEKHFSDFKFKQDSYSFSRKFVARGLHAQVDQVQLSTIVKGSGFYMVLDIFPTSETYGNFLKIPVDAEGTNQILGLPGIAHGFAVKSEEFIVSYKSSVTYGETDQYVFSLAQYFEINDFLISDRDLNAVMFKDYKSSLEKINFDTKSIRDGGIFEK